MRITIPKGKYPELENLPLSICKTLVIKALESYQNSEEYQEIVTVFSRRKKKLTKEEKVNKATVYTDKGTSNTSAISTPQVDIIEKNTIDDSNIDIMGGFNYE